MKRIILFATVGLLAACGDGVYAFTDLRPAGKKSMDGKAFAAGYETSHRYALGQVQNDQTTYNTVFTTLVALFCMVNTFRT